MRQTAIGFKSEKLSLEGILTTPQGVSEPYPALLVCHPHPVLGGDMDNPVVMAICHAVDEQGFATLRFNFRGVGDSEGEFSNGPGEQKDLGTALNVLRRWPGMNRKQITLVGYSFGASAVLGGLRHYKAARSLVLIAPPISSVRNSRIASDKRPKLFLVGQQDRVCPPVELQSALDAVQQPLQFSEIPAADHSMSAHEHEVAEKVVAFAMESLSD